MRTYASPDYNSILLHASREDGIRTGLLNTGMVRCPNFTGPLPSLVISQKAFAEVFGRGCLPHPLFLRPD